MEGMLKEKGAAFTISWKFQARSRVCWTPSPAPGLIRAAPQGSCSVTEHITVYCLLSRLDWAAVTAGASAFPDDGGVMEEQ